MRISRVVIKNLRVLESVDVSLEEKSTLIVGENNTGKSTFIHALRLCLDVLLSSTYRALIKEDIYCQIDQTRPFQVLAGVEFSDFEGNENEEALLHGTQIGEDRARIFYRFRPKRKIREAVASNDLKRPLELDDFIWELLGGGNPEIDLTDIEWQHENSDIGATAVGLQYLQSYLIAYLPPLRDAEADLIPILRESDSLGIPKSPVK